MGRGFKGYDLLNDGHPRLLTQHQSEITNLDGLARSLLSLDLYRLSWSPGMGRGLNVYCESTRRNGHDPAKRRTQRWPFRITTARTTFYPGR